MRYALIFLIALFLSLSAFGAGITVSTSNGFSANQILLNPTFTGPVTSTNLDAKYGAFASETNNGQMLTNYFLRGEWLSQQQKSVSRLPPLAIACWYGAFDGTSWTNHSGITGIAGAISNANLTLYPHGYRYIVLDDGWGNTNLDPNGLMQLHSGISNTFGIGTAGVQAFINAIHTNGWKVGLYIDGGTNLSAGGFQHGVGGILWTNVSALGRYGVDLIKQDSYEYQLELSAGIIGNNGYTIFFTGAEQNGDLPLPAVYPAMMNSPRSVSGGDITSYTQLLRWTDVIMTNGWWHWVGPGQFIDMDYIGGAYNNGGGFNAVKSHLVICALFSSPIYDDAPFTTSSPTTPWFTNEAILAIDQDSAVICAQRWFQTNGCDVYLKPLGTPTGPQYALGILNRSSLSSATVTLYFTNLDPLVNGRVQNWSAYDCVTNTGANNGWLFQNTNAFSVTIGTNDSILWRLVPGYAMTTNIVSVNWPYSVTMSVMSNGVPLTVYGAIDTDASNYIARAGTITNSQTEMLAAAVAVSLGKQHGWWNNWDALYLFRGSTSNSCAQNLISSSYGVKWNTSGVTYGWSGVTGDGSAGFGDTQFTPSTASSPNYTQGSASLFWYNQTTAPTVNIGAFLGSKNTAWAGGVYTTSTTVVTALGLNFANFGSAINPTTDGYTGNATGPWMISRLDTNLQPPSPGYAEVFYHGTVAGAVDNTSSTAVPTSSIYLLADDNSGAEHFQACTLSAVGIGGGMTTPQWKIFLADINTVEAILHLNIP